MFRSFTKEDGVLDQRPFVDSEVQYNLFHKIIDGDEYLALRSEDGNAIALQNPGYVMWLWVNEALGQEQVAELTAILAQELREQKLPGVSGRPEVAKAFADQYAQLLGVSYETYMPMESYHCPEVIEPEGVAGRMIPAQMEHLDLVAEFVAGFIYWGFGKTVTKESQLPGAERMIQSGNLYLWEVDDRVVSMGSITHRSPRHARINNVYTPVEERKMGYASALVAEMSKKVLEEGLTPILFADLTNPDSNKVYKNIGYLECGPVDHLRFDYE